MPAAFRRDIAASMAACSGKYRHSESCCESGLGSVPSTTANVSWGVGSAKQGRRDLPEALDPPRGCEQGAIPEHHIVDQTLVRLEQADRAVEGVGVAE